MPLTPKEIINLLGITTPDLSARIGSFDKLFDCKDSNIEGKFFYVRFRDGIPAIDELIDITYTRMVNFCLPRYRIEEAKRTLEENPDRMDCYVSLVTEARDLFIKTYNLNSRSGEFGEILLYMLLESVLHAPIVAYKMYLKTSLQMPVHGTDGIHLGANENNLIIYWGESKFHKKINSAIDNILDSVSNFYIHPEIRDNEIRLIHSNLSLDTTNQHLKDEIKNYLNPYNELHNKLIECHACLAGFDSTLYSKAKDISVPSCEDTFCDLYQKEFQKIVDKIINTTRLKKLETLRFSYFLLPFPSIDEAREKFQVKLWGRQ